MIKVLILTYFIRTGGASKADYNLPWGKWRVPLFQRTSSENNKLI